MRKRYLFILMSIIIAILLFEGISQVYEKIEFSKNNSHFQHSLMQYVDDRVGKQGTCDINLSKITDFKWDKMVAYEWRADSDTLLKMIGVPYTRENAEGGLVFLNHGKIVSVLRVREGAGENFPQIGIALRTEDTVRTFYPKNSKCKVLKYERSDRNDAYTIILEKVEK